jgi:hypothetical protein
VRRGGVNGGVMGRQGGTSRAADRAFHKRRAC